MAQGVGKTFPILGAIDTFGGHYWSPLDYSGPSSYVTGGDSISAPSFGMNNNVSTMIGSVSQDGTYIAVPRAMNNGVTSWQIVWINMETGLEAAAGTDLSTKTVRLSAIGY